MIMMTRRKTVMKMKIFSIGFLVISPPGNRMFAVTAFEQISVTIDVVRHVTARTPQAGKDLSEVRLDPIKRERPDRSEAFASAKPPPLIKRRPQGKKAAMVFQSRSVDGTNTSQSSIRLTNGQKSSLDGVMKRRMRMRMAGVASPTMPSLHPA